MIKSAVISACGKYRYRLVRQWDDAKPGYVMWVMLNPSTADDKIDDPTIRRCIGFSKAWGYGGMIVCNLYAYRSTDPSVMLRLSAAEAAGPENDRHVWEVMKHASLVVCAWGAPGGKHIPLTFQGSLHCLGKTKHGAPKHPLYLAASTKLEPFP